MYTCISERHPTCRIAKINTSQMQAPSKTLNLVLAINKHLKVCQLLTSYTRPSDPYFIYVSCSHPIPDHQTPILSMSAAHILYQTIRPLFYLCQPLTSYTRPSDPYFIYVSCSHSIPDHQTPILSKSYFHMLVSGKGVCSNS